MKDQVSFGDQVININGTSLSNCPMSQIAIEEIMKLFPEIQDILLLKRTIREKNRNQKRKIDFKTI